MGRKAKLKAQRRKERTRYRGELSDVVAHMQTMESLVVDLVSRCRQAGVRGTSVLRTLGLALYCWNEGVDLSEARRRGAADPRTYGEFTGWTKCALASLVGLATRPRSQGREDAAWALRELDVDEGLLGQLPAGQGASSRGMAAAYQEATLRIDQVVDTLWQKDLHQVLAEHLQA
ncbi:MAG: hypothetical protein R3F62_08570 [Planctomycetota bacterium]